jgi:hypothetical protein
VPAGHVPEDVPDAVQALFAEHLDEAGEAFTLGLFWNLEVLRGVFHPWIFLLLSLYVLLQRGL